jgi:hypothetical protein
MATIAWREEAGTMVLAHGAENPADAEWTEYIAALNKFVEARGQVRALVVTPGTAPNMGQRKQLNDLTRSKPIPTAVVTESTVGRTIVTLLTFGNPAIKAFDPGRLDEAFAHLDIAPAARPRVRAVVSDLRRAVGLADLA